eukprot:c20044_g1_i1 orf=398-2047(-)
MDAHSSVSPSFCIGQRVQSISPAKSPQIGTVKYIGAVEGYEDVWVGVDWDSGDGRHNGTVNGVRYFDTVGERSGSFVRPSALTGGVTLLEALISRYAGSSSDQENDDMYVVSVRQKNVAVKLVGKDRIVEKQKHLEELNSASLVYSGVCSAGPLGELHNALPNLKELVLTGNLIPDWHVVGHICEELPDLEVLDLSSSRIEVGANSLCIFRNLKTLVLNNCSIAWRQVEILKCSFPLLEELHLCGNDIQKFELEQEDAIVSTSNKFVEGFKFLHLLDLEKNCIEAWEEIMKLSALESLEQLHIGHNNLKQIFYHEQSATSNDAKEQNKNFKPFSSLRCLLLGGNAIQDWESVDSLNLFPNLTEVRLSENPITDLSVGGASRYMLIARLAKITMLNGSEVKQRERRDAEIRYVHFVMRVMPTNSDEEIFRHHPRYSCLKALHDVPDNYSKTGVAAGTQKMAASLQTVTLVCVAPSIGERAPSIKKLPPSTTIGKLKLICQALFKLNASKQCLYLRDQDSPIPTVLNEDLDTLEDIGIGMNATILIDEICT